MKLNKKGTSLIEFSILAPIVFFIIIGASSLIFRETKTILLKKESILVARKILEFEHLENGERLKERWVARHSAFYSSRVRGFFGRFNFAEDENNVNGNIKINRKEISHNVRLLQKDRGENIREENDEE